MAIGRITGPLLKANLLRDGVDLAFENDLLYLDVTNGRVGIRTSTPAGNLTHELTILGTTRTTDLDVTTQADIATFTVLGNTISSTSDTINLEPAGVNAVVYQGKIVTGDLQLSTNVIETTATDANLEINTLGTGTVNINSNAYIDGDLHVTGVITADGDIQIGDTNTDNIVFNADINSNIIPDDNNTWDLGSDPLLGGQAWKTTYTKDVIATNLISNSSTINGIQLELPQGNIIYVAENGNNLNAGLHENNPVATVEQALTLAVSGDTVYIYPGTYTEAFPLIVPVGVTVKGASIRAVTIQPSPSTIDKDAFLVNGETTIEDLTVSNFKYNVGDDTGYAFRFADNFKVTTRSPYIRNVTVITRGSVTTSEDPYGFDSGDAGKGALVDGSVANIDSKEAAMLFHSATFIIPNQETLIATNGVRIEWLNSFSYFADKGIYAYSGTGGFAGVGETKLRIDTRTGTWAVSDVLSYYDTDGTTVLAYGTIASIDGNYVSLENKRSGFEAVTDRIGKTVYVQGGAKLSTAQKKFGTASLSLNGTTDYLRIASEADFAFSTGAFTLEAWIYNTSQPVANQIIFDFRSANPQIVPTLYINATTNTLRLAVNGSAVIDSTSTIPLNTWTHIALAKSGTSTKMYVNGSQVGSTYTDNNTYIQGPVTIGARFDYTTPFFGYIDDVRISKGVARYTGSTYTVPTAELTGDLKTVLLLNFNGTNNSVAVFDNGITLQDLRTSSGGTASVINFADYSDFGAEIRSIGSACVYGNYGVYGDGAGVIAYLISENFAYVGSGKLSTNEPSDRIAANEVVELNGAHIYYTSVDNEGNFSVGDAFYVNQKTGAVQFNGQALNIASLQGIVFNDGVNTTTITASEIDTGNIKISGNTVESVTGNLNVVAASGEINLQNNTYVSGNLDVTGDVTIGGNIIIGDQSTDTINFVGGISSDLVPSDTATYDLGAPSLRWNTAYLSRAEIDGLVIDSNTISTTIGNDNLQLIANGSGQIYIPNNDVQIDQSLTVTQDLTVTTGITYLKDVGVTGTITQTGDFNQTGNFTTSGTAEVTGNITATGYLQMPVLRLDGNTISTTTADTDLVLLANGTGNVVFEGLQVGNNVIQSTGTNANITLTPQGTGSVVINSNQSLIIPVGSTSDRPSPPASGAIRYNTTLSRYEGWNGSYWLALGGVQDVDGNTKILAEATPGANDNVLYFYSNSNLMATIDSTKLFAERLQTNNLDIQNNTITTLLSNTDINLTTAGTGGVKIGNLRIRNNTITNTVSGAITQFAESGTGYVKISGTNGVVIPSGDTVNDRPLAPYLEVGMMRYNTALQLVEVYNGISWTSVAGTSGGITASEATDIAITTVLMLG